MRPSVTRNANTETKPIALRLPFRNEHTNSAAHFDRGPHRIQCRLRTRNRVIKYNHNTVASDLDESAMEPIDYFGNRGVKVCEHCNLFLGLCLLGKFCERP
jgi:hypothetical protein